jgi:hypothetical protein
MKAGIFCRMRALVSIIVTLAAVAGQAQTPSQGNNVVYSSAGTPSFGSQAFIDASAYGGSSLPTICSILYTIISSSSYPAMGAVIDARGLVDTKNASFTCSKTITESPWQSGATTTYVDKPSVILLPAGTITISYTWVLPGTTKLIGQGSYAPTAGMGTLITGPPVTVPPTTFTGPASGYPLAMIQLGDPGNQTCTSNPGVCTNVTVEGLSLSYQGSGQTIDGILNLDAQEMSFARRVGIYGFKGIGLRVGYLSPYNAKAQNSGPYEQLYISSGSGGGSCAQVYGTGTRGIHGITCVGSSNTGGGILIDSSSNSIEDVYVSGFADGILVGSQTTAGVKAWGNLLSNINGGGASSNLVHLCSSSPSGNCNGSIAAQDITVLGVSSSGGNTIVDDNVLTSSSPVTSTILTDSTVAMYALGEPVLINGTATFGSSRFTTSPSVPAWFVGTTQTPGSPCTPGSLYSATSGAKTLWGCISNGSSNTWVNFF